MKKHDILTPIGLLSGVGLMIFAISEGQVGLTGFYDFLSIVITIGGSFAALIVTFSLEEMLSLWKITGMLFKSPAVSKLDLIETFKDLSIKSRKSGFLAIEDDIESIEDDFLKTGLELVVDGIETDLIVEILNSHISEVENRYNRGAKIYKTWGSFAPAFGMLGTLIGLIEMLAKLDNPDIIASGMAKALITTFYGSLLANIILIPLAFNLQNKAEIEVENREMMLVGILSIKNGEPTRVLEEKLTSYLSSSEKAKYSKEGKSNKRVDRDVA